MRQRNRLQILPGFAGPEIAAIISTEATSNQQFRSDFFRFNQDLGSSDFGPTTPKKIYGTSGWNSAILGHYGGQLDP
jgi:hypothetical protein